MTHAHHGPSMMSQGYYGNGETDVIKKIVIWKIIYICKTQIDVQSLIDVQFSNIWPFFTFSNQCPITSLTYTSNDITPVRTWFWNNDGEGTRPDSEYIVHSTLADPYPNHSLTLTLTLALALTLTLTLILTLTLTLTLNLALTLNNINEWENALKTHKTKNNNIKKQIKRNTQNKTVITIIFDGNLWSWKDMRVWKGRRFENILKLDRDLR